MPKGTGSLFFIATEDIYNLTSSYLHLGSAVTTHVRSTQSETSRSSEPAATSDSDRYAALREIMEQDLAVSCSPHIDRFEDDANFGFANFDNVAIATPPETSVQLDVSNEEKQLTIGFDDDFSHVQLSHQVKEDSPVAFSAAATATAATGARPKTSIASKTTCGASISSGSVDFDPFVEEDLTVTSATQQAATWSDNIQVNTHYSPRDGAEESKESLEFAEDEEESDVVDELADKFAAFEARFPANPLEGFGDSFADFDMSSTNCVTLETNKLAKQSIPGKSEFVVDFDSAFESESKNPSHRSSIKADKIVKKSQSVNIFKRVDDPFDDDFFQPEETDNVATASPSDTSSTFNSKNKQSVNMFSTVVEDPFAWVQPFDDQVQFDDDAEEHFVP